MKLKKIIIVASSMALLTAIGFTAGCAPSTRPPITPQQQEATEEVQALPKEDANAPEEKDATADTPLPDAKQDGQEGQEKQDGQAPQNRPNANKKGRGNQPANRDNTQGKEEGATPQKPTKDFEQGDAQNEEQRAQAQSKIEALTDAQREELYALSEETQKINGKIIDKYVEFGVLDEARAEELKARIAEETAEIREEGRLPLVRGARQAKGNIAKPQGEAPTQQNPQNPF